MDFATFLERWLTERRFTQGRLALAAGISQGLVSKWVHADPERRSVPSPRNLEKLAPVLGVAYQDLLQMTGYLPARQDGKQADPDLAMVTAAWPGLDSGLRRSIKILVAAGASGFTSYKPWASVFAQVVPEVLTLRRT